MTDLVDGLDSREFKALRAVVDGHVATVTMLGPSKGNAMGPDFWHELPQVFHALHADERVRAVVLTGSGKNFSYGLDLPAMMPDWAPMLADRALAKPRNDFLTELRRLQAAVGSVAECTKPVIAAVSGWCVGGGVDLIAACDIRLASAEAKFSIREAKVAIVADLGSLQRLSGIIGEGHLRELAYTGADIIAERAAQLGLVNDVHADQETVLAAAYRLADEIAANPPLVVQGVKNVLDVNRAARVAEGLRYVGAWNAAFLPSEDLGEAVTAFMEKRPPKFQGR